MQACDSTATPTKCSRGDSFGVLLASHENITFAICIVIIKRIFVLYSVLGSRVKTLFVTQTSRNCNVASASVSYHKVPRIRNRGAGYVTITTCLGDKQCFHSRAEYWRTVCSNKVGQQFFSSAMLHLRKTRFIAHSYIVTSRCIYSFYLPFLS